MSITVDGVPQSITHQQLVDWLAELGFDSEHLRSLRVDRGAITAELIALSSQGQPFVRDGKVATHQVVVQVGQRPNATGRLREEDT